MKILHVVGARPNFMKVAPVRSALAACNSIRQVLVHTGQHYDAFMSDVFFQQLDIPEPDYNLEVGSGSHARQTADIMVRLEPLILETKPDLVLVYGDVNSTVAAALVCSKLLVPLATLKLDCVLSIERCRRKSTGCLRTAWRIFSLLHPPTATKTDS